MKVNCIHYTQAMVFVLLTACFSQAAIVADSVADFSGTQGQGNWYYGYYPGTLSPSSFVLMGTFNPPGRPNYWVVEDGPALPNFFTGLNDIGGHPNGVLGDRSDAIHYAVRRWIVESSGLYTISGNIGDLESGPGGNGVIGRIFSGDIEVYTQSISEGDFSGVNYSLTFNLTAGTTLDFVIDANGDNDLFDNTRFTAMISSAAIPEPSSLLLLVGGCMVAFGRRRYVSC